MIQLEAEGRTLCPTSSTRAILYCDRVKNLDFEENDSKRKEAAWSKILIQLGGHNSET